MCRLLHEPVYVYNKICDIESASSAPAHKYPFQICFYKCWLSWVAFASLFAVEWLWIKFSIALLSIECEAHKFEMLVFLRLIEFTFRVVAITSFHFFTKWKGCAAWWIHKASKEIGSIATFYFHSYFSFSIFSFSSVVGPHLVSFIWWECLHLAL